MPAQSMPAAIDEARNKTREEHVKPVALRPESDNGARAKAREAHAKSVVMRPENDAARAKAREAHAKRAAKEAAIRELVKKEMAEQAATARSRALEELKANGGSAADRRDEMLGSAMRVLMAELPPTAKTRPARPTSTPAGATVFAAIDQSAVPAEPALSTVAQLGLQILQEKSQKDREMSDELEQLAARRAARKQAMQLTRDRAAAGLGAELPEDRVAAHKSLFSWVPPPLPAAALPLAGEEDEEVERR